MAVSKRKFHKTTFKITVLSEEPIPDDIELETLAREAMVGDYVMQFYQADHKLLPADQIAQALYDVGSEPGFFMLNDDGSDAE